LGATILIDQIYIEKSYTIIIYYILRLTYFAILLAPNLSNLLSYLIYLFILPTPFTYLYEVSIYLLIYLLIYSSIYLLIY